MSKNGRYKFRAPTNRLAKKSYHEHYGKLLAEERIWEVKSAKYGLLSKFDRFSDLFKLPKREGYTSLNRKDEYRKALDLYSGNELARAIINLRTSAIFYPGISNPSGLDVRGSNRKLVEFTRNLIDFNNLNFHDLAREAEIAGDAFLTFEEDKDKTRIISLDASSTESVLGTKGVRNVESYTISGGSDKDLTLSADKVQHLKFNSTTTSQYGKSVLKPVFYWFDVLDTLFEKNWLRGAQYFGNPQLAIIGVPGPYQATVQSQLEGNVQRAGRVLILPPETDLKTPDYSLSFPINDIVGWVFRIITIATETPITLLGTADASSRGSAFFSNSRFTLTVKPIREVWRIGLRNLFIKIFKASGEIPEGSFPSSREFDLGFYIPFERDLSDIADLVSAYREKGLISIKSSREIIGLDHTDEEEFMKSEPKFIPDVYPQVTQVSIDDKTKKGTQAGKGNGNSANSS